MSANDIRYGRGGGREHKGPMPATVTIDGRRVKVAGTVYVRCLCPVAGYWTSAVAVGTPCPMCGVRREVRPERRPDPLAAEGVAG